MYCVYVLSFLDCGQLYTYYGMTSQNPPYKRWRNGKSYLVQNKKFRSLHNPTFLGAYILGYYPTRAIARAVERNYTRVNKNRPNGLNSYT